MIRIENLTKIFHRNTVNEKRAMDGLSMEIQDGDFITVIGSNGAGKSTFLNLIAGTCLPDSGRIAIDGEDITHLPEHRRARYLGRIFQDPLMGTAGSMTIEENMAMAEIRGKPRGLRWGIQRKRRIFYREILKTLNLGLEDRLTSPVSLLSGGQRQSMTLLMATLSTPRLLLLDEHTASLDPLTARRVIDLTDAIVRENRLTTIMVTHNMQQAIAYGNRMMMLHQGKIRFDFAREEKEKLTVEDVVKKFASDLSDETLLCMPVHRAEA